MYRSILSLSKIAQKMWHDHPLNHRNVRTERAVWLGFGGDIEVGAEDDQNLKSGEVGNIGGVLYKITGLAPLCQICKETLKIPPL